MWGNILNSVFQTTSILLNFKLGHSWFLRKWEIFTGWLLRVLFLLLEQNCIIAILLLFMQLPQGGKDCIPSICSVVFLKSTPNTSKCGCCHHCYLLTFCKPLHDRSLYRFKTIAFPSIRYVTVIFKEKMGGLRIWWTGAPY